MSNSGGGAARGDNLIENHRYSYDICCTTGEKCPHTQTSIAFTKEDLVGITISHHDLLVIMPIFGRRDGGRSRPVHVLVDMGVFVDVMYWDVFNNLDLSIGGPPFKGFKQNDIMVAGVIKLSITHN